MGAYQINIYSDWQPVVWAVNQARLKKLLKSILSREGAPAGVFNFILTDNRGIRRLNRRFLGANRVTDVIAFPLSDCRGMPTDRVIGEVVISAEEAKRQARARHIPVDSEVCLYCVHGLLHLLGYDDMIKSKRLKMERKQSEYLSRWIPA